ncbi:MAG: AbrB family transcriptional regulator [Pseudomonadota bacterium]
MIPLPKLAEALGLCALGALGGLMAQALNLPLPFMLGAICIAAPYAVARFAYNEHVPYFPKPIRTLFVGVIGALIGSTVTPDLLALFPALWPSLLAVVLFVVVAHGIGYLVMRRIGGYSRGLAILGGMPGGLIEAISLAESAGLDAKLITVQHFARIIVVVLTVPFLFLIWSGDVVGSAAGATPSTGAYGLMDVVLLMGFSLLGSRLGGFLKLPARHLTGPLILSALFHATGLIDTQTPVWLLALAQLMVGVGLGCQFAGAALGVLFKAIGLSVINVVFILTLALGFSWGLVQLTPLSAEALFISFAPGGVTEMGLIALSLQIAPAIIAAHHLLRIFLTVFLVSWLLKRIDLNSP